VYGPWPYPSYPPYYWPTPGYAFGSALMTGIAFGTGIAITNALWGGCNWGRGDVDINVNRYNNINVNRQISANQNNVNWQHNAENRKGVPYRDSNTRAKYDRPVPGAENRAEYRGKDGQRDASREKAQAAMKDRGVDPAKGREQLRDDPQARQRAEAATRDMNRDPQRDRAQSAAQSRDRAAAQNVDRSQAKQTAQSRAGTRDNALAGAGSAQSRQQIDRGNASRQAAQAHPAASRPSAGAGGGGGARAAGAARAGGGGGARMAR
jgi:hypothetical protein